MTDNGQLALDTINCALNMAGYDIAKMTQFEKAHALLDMAQELKARQHCTGLCDECPNKTLCYDYIPDTGPAVALNMARAIAKSVRRWAS